MFVLNLYLEANAVSMKSRIEFAQVPPRPQEGRSRFNQVLKHPFFAWTGFRPPIAQHTQAEHEALMRYSHDIRTIVEIGVAEGASAVGLRESISPQGTLYLIDPFHLSRIPALNFVKRAAHRAVQAAGTSRVVWIEAFSHEAARNWNLPIDFLFIDGDHTETAVEQDWLDWSPFVTQQGTVAFHDARLFPSGWTAPDYGPVRFVDRSFRQNSIGSWGITEEIDSLVFVSRRKPS